MQRMETDLLVVGAGPAGLSTAITADRGGRDVLVCESGGQAPAVSASAVCEVASESPYFDLAACRPRGIGGSTSVWGGYLEPFTDAQLAGWPLDPARYREFVVKAHDLIGSHAPGVEQDWQFADKAHELSEGHLRTETIPILGPRNLGHVWAGQADFGLTLKLDTNLTRIAWSPDGGSVEEMRFAGPDGELRIRAGEYVLACGGIENARVLLTSEYAAHDTAGPALLGRGFMEHPYVDLMMLAASPEEMDSAFFQERVDPGSTAGQGVVGVLAGRTRGADPRRFKVYLEPIGLNWDAKLPLLRDGGAYRQRIDETEGCVVIVSLEQLPWNDNRVELTGNTNDDGLARGQLCWNLTPHDFESLHAITKELTSMFSGLGFGTSVFDEATWRRRVIGGPHHMGTTRMSESPAQGVVDANQRLHGVDNLYIGGCSVFPTGGVVAPTLSIIALGIRLGELLSHG